MPAIAAPALLSFLKQVSAEASWDKKRIAEILRVTAAEAGQIAATLELLGYAESVRGAKNGWRNTQQGNAVAGAKPPRFNRDSVVEALNELRARAEQFNSDAASRFRVTGLAAFGDFLDKHDKAQAADVGVALEPVQAGELAPGAAMEHKREEDVLGHLRARSPLMHLYLMEDWMRRRSHLELLQRA
jgi:hypothetical protein